MSRTIGVSLKMYMGLQRTRAWMEELAALVREEPSGEIELFVMPSFVSLSDARAALRGTPVALGAQDVFWEDEGAYTGEISAPMLVEAGCRYVEVGHAERRRIFGETDEIVARKTAAVVRAGLVPVLCIGEDRPGAPEAAMAACLGQIEAAMRGLAEDAPLVVAYEPVWAIGADRPAGPEHVAAVADGLRAALGGRRDARLLYGGSAGPGLLSRLGRSVDGLFLGRFAHDIAMLRVVLDEARGTIGAGGGLPDGSPDRTWR